MGRAGGVITFVRTVSTTSSENRKTCEKACPSIGKGMTRFLRFAKTLSTASSENKLLSHQTFKNPKP